VGMDCLRGGNRNSLLRESLELRSPGSTHRPPPVTRDAR
jgi:hypothetical protein